MTTLALTILAVVVVVKVLAAQHGRDEADRKLDAAERASRRRLQDARMALLKAQVEERFGRVYN